MNKVILVGRLVKDAVSFAEGKVVKIKLATRTGYDAKNQKERIAFVPATLFSMSPAQIEQLKKGMQVGIEGIVTETTYKKNNETVYAVDVQVNKGGLNFV
ncbi:MAG: single-stranded DNA-binding protein [Planctomycetes bacterium]|nr:single-stranded DNA-binding protein [Planctomycetota bacterium]